MTPYLKWPLLIVVVVLGLMVIGALDQTTKDALKVQHILKTIEKHPPQPDKGKRSAEVTERELNAYATYRLSQEKSPIISSLTVGLLPDDQVKGTLKLDAGQLNLSILLGDELDFDFQGRIFSRNGTARIELSELKLHGKAIKPQTLDMVLSAVALYQGTEIGQVGDWYTLPKGMDRVAVKLGKAVLYY